MGHGGEDDGGSNFVAMVVGKEKKKGICSPTFGTSTPSESCAKSHYYSSSVWIGQS